MYYYFGPTHSFSSLTDGTIAEASTSHCYLQTGRSLCVHIATPHWVCPLTCKHFQCSWMFFSSDLRSQGIGWSQLTNFAQCLAFLPCVSLCSASSLQPPEQRPRPPFLSLALSPAAIAAVLDIRKSTFKSDFFLFLKTQNFYLGLSREPLLSLTASLLWVSMSQPGKQSRFLTHLSFLLCLGTNNYCIARVLLSVENAMITLLKLVFALVFVRDAGAGWEGVAFFLPILAWPPHCWWGGSCLWFWGAGGDRVVPKTPSQNHISPNNLSGILAWKWLSFHGSSVSFNSFLS